MTHNDTPAETEITKAIRREKLSDPMIEAITYRYNGVQGSMVYCEPRTEKALIRRGIMHPVDSCLTEKGHHLARLILGLPGAPEDTIVTPQDAIKEHDLTDPMVEALRYVVRGWGPAPKTGTWVALINRKLVTAQTPDTGHQHLLTELGAAAATALFPVPLVATVQALAEAPALEVEQLDSDDENLATWDRTFPCPTFTAPVDARDEEIRRLKAQVESLQKGHAALLDRNTDRQTQRDRLARTIAYEFGHNFGPWDGENPRTVEENHRRPHLVRLYRRGAMRNPESLTAEIRRSVLGIVESTPRTVTGPTAGQMIDDLMWLGWLHAYVLESGTVDRRGWQDRERGEQDGWEELGLYDLEGDEVDSLPLWAQMTPQEAFCHSVISGSWSRWEEPEYCGDAVGREEWFRTGDESALRCEAHAPVDVDRDALDL